MQTTKLRIYNGPESNTIEKEERLEATVSLGELLPLMTDAVADGRLWLQDFDNDEVKISMDLYELLLSYQYHRHPSA